MPAFISHSMQDGALFSTLRAGLSAAGVETWDPDSLGTGASLRDQLRQAIERCEVCVFLATQNSIASNWCMAEIGAFWGAGKRVLVFVADPSVDSSKFPPQLQGDLWTDSFERLARDAKGLLAGA